MFTIMNVIKGVKMNERTLFGRTSKCNCVYSLLQVFQFLFICHCFMIRNPFNVMGSSLGGRLGCGKDVFYEFRYVLADSWFTCAKIIKYIRGRHIKCDYLGMIKIGDDSRTKYHFERKDLNAPAIIKALEKRGKKKYSRKFKCWYMSADVIFADTPVRLFFVRRSKRGPWSGLLCTDLRLGFFEAYKIYSRRWSLEVIFKESKGLLGLGKCQSSNFAAQIASTSLVALQYNVLSVVKRFEAYETIGELFREATQDSLEITISERIWGAILELVAAIAKVFNITDEDVLEAVVNQSDELAHICELYKLKMAC